MSKSGNHDALNRVLTTLYRSLPMYLTYTSPWTHGGDERAVEALGRIVEDQRQLSTRVAEYIVPHYGPVDLGDYPLDFPDMHDLAVDYLVGKLVECQKRDVATIEACAAEITADPEGRALAEEALGSARAHLETLEELAADLAKHGVSWAKS